MINTNTNNKTKMAKELGVSRSSLYYRHKKSEIDLEVKNQIESVMTEHSAYGHKRIALELKLNPPSIIHSDQGSEYDSQDFVDLVLSRGVRFSMSQKGSPWENGYQESFYGKFKTEFGDFNRFEDIGELVEEIYHQIYYYNNQRIHTSLKMTPAKFRNNYQLANVKHTA